MTSPACIWWGFLDRYLYSFQAWALSRESKVHKKGLCIAAQKRGAFLEMSGWLFIYRLFMYVVCLWLVPSSPWEVIETLGLLPRITIEHACSVDSLFSFSVVSVCAQPQSMVLLSSSVCIPADNHCLDKLVILDPSTRVSAEWSGRSRRRLQNFGGSSDISTLVYFLFDRCAAYPTTYIN